MDPSVFRRKELRWLIGLGVPLVLAAGVAFLWFFQSSPPCVFYELTGLLCPGCGTGRAVLALLDGRLYAAFRYQPLFILCSPVLAYYLCKLYLAFVLGRDVLPFPEVRSRWVGVTVLGVILAYWVFRNLPFVPFCYLAPTAV